MQSSSVHVLLILQRSHPLTKLDGMIDSPNESSSSSSTAPELMQKVYPRTYKLRFPQLDNKDKIVSEDNMVKRFVTFPIFR